ncbi:hypothetical protein Cgig2_028020 [Carnegiea gigantea]|uniref:Protein FAR1-RELATED SEQUENCE n=1 Tax=Carnegiea gigantea TaxID=171969 RepID=A0A9Q1JPX2_9CARY|nr:hypothetical protein Cgig2_028020 [Carnegiea gigantea]
MQEHASSTFYHEEFSETSWKLSESGISKARRESFVKKVRKEAFQYDDAKFILAYLEGKKSVDTSFFLRYTKDEDGSLENLLWYDRQSRIEYKTFGHVLVFDTTYKHNGMRSILRWELMHRLIKASIDPGMKYANIKQIPSGCIPCRWTIGAMEYIMLNEDALIQQEEDCHNTSHTKHTCPVYVNTKPYTISLECFPINPPKNDSTNSRSTHDVLIRLQPYAYTEGERQQVEYSEEVAKLEKNCHIVDLFPKVDW